MRINTANAEGHAPESLDLEITGADLRSAELAEARKFLTVAPVAMAVVFLTLFIENNAARSLLVAGYIGAQLASVFGVSKAARALKMGFPTRILFLFLAMTPVFNLIAIAYFFGRSKPEAGASKEDRKRQALIDAAKLRARQREQDRKPPQPSVTPAPAAAPTTKAPDLQPLNFSMNEPSQSGSPTQKLTAEAQQRLRERLSTAIPRIRSLVETGVNDGTPMRIRMVLPPPGIDPSQVSLPAMRSTAGIFGVQYVIDEGAHYIAVAASEVEAAGLTLDELHQMALRNLRKLVTSAQTGLKLRRLNQGDPSNQAIMLTLDGENEASLLLLDELWDKALLKHIPNGVMAVAPARDVCIFIDFGAATQGGLGDLQEAIVKIHQARGGAFNSILHRQNGRWVIGANVDGLPPTTD